MKRLNYYLLLIRAISKLIYWIWCSGGRNWFRYFTAMLSSSLSVLSCFFFSRFFTRFNMIIGDPYLLNSWLKCAPRITLCFRRNVFFFFFFHISELTVGSFYVNTCGLYVRIGQIACYSRFRDHFANVLAPMSGHRTAHLHERAKPSLAQRTHARIMNDLFRFYLVRNVSLDSYIYIYSFVDYYGKTDFVTRVNSLPLVLTSKLAPRLRNRVPAYLLLLLATTVTYMDLPKMLTFDWPINPCIIYSIQSGCKSFSAGFKRWEFHTKRRCGLLRIP